MSEEPQMIDVVNLPIGRRLRPGQRFHVRGIRAGWYRVLSIDTGHHSVQAVSERNGGIYTVRYNEISSVEAVKAYTDRRQT